MLNLRKFFLYLLLFSFFLTLENCAPKETEVKPITVYKERVKEVRIKIKPKTTCYKTLPNFFSKEKIKFWSKCVGKDCYLLFKDTEFGKIRLYLKETRECFRKLDKFYKEEESKK